MFSANPAGAVQPSTYSALRDSKTVIITTDDYERVQQVTTLYPSVKSFVRPSGNAKRLAAESLNRAFQKNGRVSYPWCRPGHEQCAEPLFERVIQTMQQRRLPLALIRAVAIEPLDSKFGTVEFVYALSKRAGSNKGKRC